MLFFFFVLSDPSFLRCRHLEGSVVKNSWRRTFATMVMKNFCTALGRHPKCESRVSEERDTLDFGGDGT